MPNGEEHLSGEEGQLVAFMRSLDERVGRIEENLQVINRELGVLAGKVKGNSTVTLLIKFVVFPLIVVVGGLVGVKILWPGG